MSANAGKANVAARAFAQRPHQRRAKPVAGFLARNDKNLERPR